MDKVQVCSYHFKAPYHAVLAFLKNPLNLVHLPGSGSRDTETGGLPGGAYGLALASVPAALALRVMMCCVVFWAFRDGGGDDTTHTTMQHVHCPYVIYVEEAIY